MGMPLTLTAAGVWRSHAEGGGGRGRGGSALFATLCAGVRLRFATRFGSMILTPFSALCNCVCVYGGEGWEGMIVALPWKGWLSAAELLRTGGGVSSFCGDELLTVLTD